MKKIKQPHGGAIVNAEKGETANPNGRPPKGFKGFALHCRGLGYDEVTDKQVEEAFRLLIDMPVFEVKRIAGKPDEEFDAEDFNNTHPAVLRLVAGEFFKKRGQEMLKQVLDRAFGAAKERKEVTGANGGPIKLDALSIDELRNLSELLGKTNGG